MPSKFDISLFIVIIWFDVNSNKIANVGYVVIELKQLTT